MPHKRGFTLFEILIVISIVGLVSGVAGTSAKNQIEKSQDATRKGDLSRISEAFEHYYNDHGCYPSQAEWDMATCGTNPDFTKSYLNKFPCDPTHKTPYLYEATDKEGNACSGSCGDCYGYRLLTSLSSQKDPQIVEVGCDGTSGCGVASDTLVYNYGTAKGTTVAAACKKENAECAINQSGKECCEGLTCQPKNPNSENGKCVVEETTTPTSFITPSIPASPSATLTPIPTPAPLCNSYGMTGIWGKSQIYPTFGKIYIRGSNPGEFDENGDIVIGLDGNIYVTERLNYRIQIFSPSMTYLRQWNMPRQTGDKENRPHSIAFNSKGFAFVTDNWNDRVVKFDSNGNVIALWGSRGIEPGQFNMLSGVAVDSQDNVYISDRWNYRIQKFTENGEFIMQWGSKGSGNGQFDFPEGLAFDTNDKLYVADGNNSRIQIFSSSGAFISKFGTKGETGTNLSKIGLYPGQFLMPSDVFVDKNGKIYVADTLNFRVQVFDASGKFITMFGEPYLYNSSCYVNGKACFGNVMGVTVRNNGTMLIADYFKVIEATCQ